MTGISHSAEEKRNNLACTCHSAPNGFGGVDLCEECCSCDVDAVVNYLQHRAALLERDQPRIAAALSAEARRIKRGDHLRSNDG